MKPRRTHSSNAVYELQGGTEDNSLWVESSEDGTIASVWEPTPEEREAISNGSNVLLTVFYAQPPVTLGITNTPLGKRPE